PEQLGPDGARLRCSACSAVFRVRAPAPPAPPTASDPERSALAPSGAAEGRGARSAPSLAPVQHREVSDVEKGPTWDRERLVVVAHADAETAKVVAEALEQWGLETLVAHDG